MSNSITPNSFRGVPLPTRRPQSPISTTPPTAAQSAPFTLQHNDAFTPHFAGSRRRRSESPESYADRLSKEAHQAKWKKAISTFKKSDPKDFRQLAETLWDNKPGKLQFLQTLGPFYLKPERLTYPINPEDVSAGIDLLSTFYNTAEGDVAGYEAIKTKIIDWAEDLQG